MDPYVDGGSIIVEDPTIASTLMNKGNYGSPLSGGGSELSLIEAAYLVENQRIEVKRRRGGRKASLPEILSLGLDSNPSFLENLMVFRDLRNRGLVVIGKGEGKWNVFPRGKRPSNGKADTWVNVYREHDRVSLLDLWKDSRSRESMRVKLVGSIVDSDWDVTHYVIRSSFEEMNTGAPGIETFNTARTGIDGGGSVISGKDVDRIGERYCMGTDMEGAKLLSPEEDRALFGGPSDEMKFNTYMDLRSKGLLPRTGFKYGAHFRVYSENSLEDHSRYLVHCVEQESSFTWEELSRMCRLSHSVRKRFLFSIPSEGMREPHHNGNGPLYLEIAWTRL